MTSRPHIIVIGGGLIGLSSAQFLLLKGANVTVVERQTMAMRGASYANSAMLHLSQATPWVSVIGKDYLEANASKHVLWLARQSKPLIDKNAQRLSLNMRQRSSGCLQVFTDIENWKTAQTQYDNLGVEYKRQPAGGILGDMPSLFFPNDHSGDAFEYGQALALDIEKKGVSFKTGRAAELRYENGRVKGVDFGAEYFDADHVVLACGAASQSLAKTVGLSLPLKAIQGYSLDYKLPSELELPRIPIMHAESRSCLTVFENKFRLSGTVGRSDSEYLIQTWSKLMPSLKPHLVNSLSPEWKGQRPGSLMGRPLIGRSAVPGLWVNTGHAHMGWTLCAGAGQLLAEMIVDGKTDGRFAVTSL